MVLTERFDSAHNALMLGGGRVEELRFGQRLSAAQMLGQSGGRAVECVEAKILCNTLEGVGGAERALPVCGRDGLAQLRKARVGRVLEDEAVNQRLARQTMEGILVAAVDLFIEFLLLC